MSAYMVTDACIRRCVTHLNQGACENGDLLGRQMINLNSQSVAARYKDQTELPLEEIEFFYRPQSKGEVNLPADQELVMKEYCALDNWLYQCSEGKCPETDLYKKVEKAKNYLAQDMICCLPLHNEFSRKE